MKHPNCPTSQITKPNNKKNDHSDKPQMNKQTRKQCKTRMDFVITKQNKRALTQRKRINGKSSLQKTLETTMFEPPTPQIIQH